MIGLQVPNFLGQRNLINILNQSSAIGIMAIGMTMVFLVGGIDLSIAANMGFSSIIGAMLMRDGLNPFVACLIMILVSGLIGTINGYAVSYLNMIPFVVTLSMMYVTSGASVWITESTSVTGLPDSFSDTILVKIGGIPLPVYIMLFLGIVCTIYIKSTMHGRWIYSVGTNITAARIAGIPVKKVKIWAYILAGVFAGIGAILNTARLASASATMGQSVVVLDVASSAVVGGVSLYGGVGTPIMAIIGALLITLISNSMNMLGVSYYITLIIKGFVIIAFIGFDAWLRRRQ
jgi:ribose transport system permease protein